MTKKKEEKTKVANPVPIVETPIHIDEFLATKHELRVEVQAGFRIFMRGKSYQKSFGDFETELENYFKRKI